MNNDNYVKSLMDKVIQKENDYKKSHKIFIDRIISMMKDYDISMQEAILNDMDGFPDAPGATEMDFLYELDFYFWTNGLKLEDTTLYIDIITGKHKDYVLETLNEIE